MDDTPFEVQVNLEHGNPLKLKFKRLVSSCGLLFLLDAN